MARLPGPRRQKALLHRRARALACHPRMRAGSPRHRPRNPTIAGDRPPRYGNIETLLPAEIVTGRRDILVPIRTSAKQIKTGRSLLRGPRWHQDRDGAPTDRNRDREVSPTGKPSIYETPSIYHTGQRPWNCVTIASGAPCCAKKSKNA